VYVVTEKNEVERRNVRVGQLYGQSRVIENGAVRPGDKLIVDGLLRVRPGVEVNPKPAPVQKAAAEAARALPQAPMPRAK
jgi:multidrug efflux pump subunit AcrA (membrane-fusion protein)